MSVSTEETSPSVVATVIVDLRRVLIVKNTKGYTVMKDRMRASKFCVVLMCIIILSKLYPTLTMGVTS